ncbi:MAG: hypothetical protein IJN57_09835 [Oscillospiraceae bacterium]|nr:hypothetical protein [Oscillospiraceae bacterium]
MTDTEKNEILLALRSQLTGDLSKDMVFLEAKANEYAASGDNDVVHAISEMAVNLLSDKDKQFMKQKLYIGERRLDAVYGEAASLMRQHLYDKALVLTGMLYDKIRKEFAETPDKRFYSFRNLLESNLYYTMYHPTKHLERAPFDFVRFLSAHAFNLIEVRRPQEAIAVLEEAIRFNPVCPDPRFELAEAYKVLAMPEKLLEVIKETLPISVTPYALSRCYANMGYYCVEKKDYENAVCFYFESLLYADHPAIPGELKHVSLLMGKKIAPPKREEVLKAFADYEIPNGPDQNVLGVATALANLSVEKHEWEPAAFYLRVLFDLTHDDETKALLERVEAELAKEKEAAAAPSEDESQKG